MMVDSDKYETLYSKPK